MNRLILRVTAMGSLANTLLQLGLLPQIARRNFCLIGAIAIAISTTQVRAQDRQDEVYDYARALQAKNPHLCIALGLIDGERERVKHFGCEIFDYFQIGSITKVYTTTALAASTHVTPETTLGEIFADRISSDAQRITLLQLATHTSGLPRLPDNMAPSSFEDPYLDYGEEELMTYLRSYSVAADEQANFVYSNLGLGLLGQALAVSEGKAYSQLISDSVLRPLGLTQTWFDHQGAVLAGEVLQGHGSDGKPNTNWSFDALAGAGALWSNMPDMMRFARAQLGQVESPLKSAIKDTHAIRSKAGPVMEVGLGWMFDTRDPAHTWHNGVTAGFRSWLGFDQSRNRAVVVLANGVVSETDLMGQALMGSGVRLPSLAVGPKLVREQAAAYLGRYQLAPQAMLDVTMDEGELYVQLSSQPKFRLLVTGEDQFRTETIPAEFLFSREQAQVTRVTVLQGGQEIKARRIGDVPNRAKLVLTAGQLERFVGKYRLRRGLELTITRQGTALWAQATGQQNLPIFAESENRFFYEEVAADLEFNIEENEVKGVWLHQNGKHYGQKIEK